MLHHRERRRFSIEEYLSLEETATCKSEFFNGEIFSMSGGSLEHNRLSRNVLGELYVALKGKKCEVLPSDIRLHMRVHQVFTYPDLLVVCGKPRLLRNRRDTVTDATLIVEVLSPSTQDYDRTEKFRIYRSLPSFQEYLLVSQDAVRLEQHRRQAPAQWLMTEHTALDQQISLTSINVSLSLRSIYAGVL
ncbi:Uma2 family endonuclease [bacterium]|nr:Uma2 family endonuclease [bacterium]